MVHSWPRSTIMGYPIMSAQAARGTLTYIEEQTLGGFRSMGRGQIGLQTLQMDVLIPYRDSIAYQHDEAQFLINKMIDGIYSIGSGRVCQHCGAYMTAGSVVCPRCSAPTMMLPLVSPRSLPLWLESSNMGFMDGSMMSGAEVRQDMIISISFKIYDDVYWAQNGLELFGNLGAGINLQRGLFVCQWCGGVSREGESCQHCSGTRLPLTEAVSVERDCVYCGASVRGGIVCPQCSALVSGRAFMEVV